MKQKKDLIKNTMMIAIGKCSTQVISFLLLPLYTSVLTTAEYGDYDLLNTLSIFIIPFITLLMEESMFRFLIDAKDEEERSNIVSQTVILTLLNMLVSTVAMLIVGSLVGYKYTVYLILFIFASILSTLAGSVSRGEGNYKLYSIFASLSSFFTVLLNVIFIVVFKMGVVSLFLSYILSNSLVSIWLLLKMKVYKLVSLKKINKNKIKEMIKYSFPLIPNSISLIIINLSDRVIVSAVLGISANGIYAIANKFPSVINTFYSFFYMAWKESASKVVKNEDKDKFYNSIYFNLKHLLEAVSILIIALLPIVFPILINSNYNEAYKYIPILIISIYFSNISSFCGGIFAAYKKTGIMGSSTVIGAIINIVVHLTLIRFIGLYAAMISTLVSTFVVYIYRRYKMKDLLTLDVDKTFIISVIIFALLIGIYYLGNIYLYVLGGILGVLYSIYLNKHLFDIIINKLNRKIKRA